MSAIADFLANVDGFQKLDGDQLNHIASHAEIREYAPEAPLMRVGEPGDCMHILLEGKVRVPITGADGAEKMVIHLGPGDLVGEMALLTGEPRSADVIAEGQVRSVVLHQDVIQPVLENTPELAGFLSEILGRRLKEGGIEAIGKYRLLGLIADGTTGSVFEAIHPGLGRVVAVKMMFHSLVYRPRFRDRFLQEARTMAGMAHPNIAQVYDTGEAYATYYIVMEKLAGTDLSRMLATRGKLPADEVARILSQVSAALSYAHSQGIAHRDVKPHNVSIDEDGHAKLMDFGIAKSFVDTVEAGAKRSVDGTPQYIAPETALGRPGDGRVDIYALGVMGFQMLTGSLPFKANSVRDMLKAHVQLAPPDVRELVPDVPDGLARFIEGAMKKKPEERLSDWTTIQRLLGGEGSAELGRPAREHLLRIRYHPEAAPKVRAATQQLIQSLADIPGVDVAEAALSSAAPGGRSSEEEGS